MVVAAKNQTRVHIKEGNSTLWTSTLNQLDILRYFTSNDSQSMSVTSDEPVSVITGTSCATIPEDVPACDVIIEQMLPFQSLDNIYIAPPTPPKIAYELKVTHLNDYVLDTTCFNNSTATVCTKDTSHSIRMGTEPTVISSNEIISVVQFGFGNQYPKIGVGDPFMTVIQGLRNFLNSYFFAIPRVYNNTDNHIAITIPTMDLNGLIIDGSNLTVPQKNIFNVSAPLECYSVFILDIGVGYHHIYHVNDDVKFGLTVYGLGAVTEKYVGFGYPAGMQLSMFDNSSSSFVCSAPSSNSDNSSHSDILWIALGAGLGSLVLLSMVTCLIIFLVKRKKMRKSSVKPENEGSSQSMKDLKSESDNTAPDGYKN